MINDQTYREGVNQIGDIVGIFEDTHQFSPVELTMFDIIQVPNLTRAEFTGALTSPEIRHAVDTDGVERTVWRNSESDPWRELVAPVKYTWTTIGVDTEAGDILQSSEIDRDTKLSLLSQFGNNTSFQDDNQTVVDVAEVLD